MGNNILVTGAAGFAGSGLTRRLLDRGHHVTALDILAPEEVKVGRLGSTPFENPNFSYLWKSVQELRPEEVEDKDVLVHLAAQADVPLGYPAPRWNVLENVEGTVDVLEACRQAQPNGPKLVVYAGTAHEMEAEPTRLPLTEESELRPGTPYGFSKAAGELACHTWRRSYGVPTCIMSNGVVVGPGMRRQIFLYIWLKNILKGKSIILEGGGTQGRDLTYVDDVLDAWISVIEKDPKEVVGEKFQVSYGEEHTVKELLDMCFEVTGKSVPIIHKPSRPGEENMRELFDCSKARERLGYHPKYDARESIRKTMEWIVANEMDR